MHSRHVCLASTSALLRLEKIVYDDWDQASLLNPAVRLSALFYRTSGVLITGPHPLCLMVDPVEIAPKLEVFRLTAVEPPVSAGGEQDRAVGPEELFLAFKKRGRRMMLVTRRHVARSRADAGEVSIEVDDMLVIRDAGGQQVFVLADQEQPGTLLVTRVEAELPDDGATLVAVRHL